MGTGRFATCASGSAKCLEGSAPSLPRSTDGAVPSTANLATSSATFLLVFHEGPERLRADVVLDPFGVGLRHRFGNAE